MGLGDIERIVRTVYAVTDSASGPMQTILGLARSAASTLAAPIVMAVSAVGVGAAVQQLVSVSAAYEDTMGAIAGTFSGLGMAGNSDPLTQFNRGLGMAEQTMNAITLAAAVLPGEANDYISVFRDGLPFVREAIGGTLEQMYGFTNQMTAVGSALRVPAELIGRDIQDMLAPGRGHASIAQTQMFKALLPFMKQVQGYANLTAESFNSLNQHVRGELVSRTLQRFGPMLDHASQSFGAMAGALKSTSEMFLRMGGAPLFDEIKRAMGTINGLFFDAQGHITALGSALVSVAKIVSTTLAGALARAGTVLAKLPAILASKSFNERLDRFARVLTGIGRASGVGGLADRASAAIHRPVTGASLVAGGALLGPVTGSLMVFATHTTAVI